MNKKISRFDQIVIGFLTAVSILITLVIWRGDQIGMQVVSIFPTGDASSAQTAIKVRFDTPIATANQLAITLDPATNGQWRIDRNELIFQPDAPLQSNTAYSVMIDGNLQNEQGRTLKRPLQWTFTTGEPRILFISWEADSKNQIYQASPTGDAPPRPLSTVSSDVTDFELSPDGSTIIFSVANGAEGGADLWQMNADGTEQRLLLACEQATCSQMVWVPNSSRLIYERRNIATLDAPPGLPRLWWLDAVTGETVPLFQDSQILGLAATVSANGRFLSFVSPSDQGIQVYRLEDGSGFAIPNRMGSPGAWQPETDNLVLTDIQLLDDNAWEIVLLTVDIESETATLLEDEPPFAVDDGTPLFAPNGRFLAFGRKEARTATGRQLWLMDMASGETRPVTNEPDVHYGPFAWSENGRYILAQQNRLKEQFAQSTLVLYDLETETWREIAAPAVPPFAWIP